MAKSITAIIKSYLRDKGISQVYLAELLEESPQNLANKLKKNDLSTDYVRRVSLALEHDFFFDLSGQLKLKNKSILNEDELIYVNRDKYTTLLEENLELVRQLAKALKK